MCTSLKKYHLEPGICSLKISNFVFCHFLVLSGFPSAKSMYHQGITTGIKYTSSIIEIF